MATLELPPRKCLTCISNGAQCDGGFPTCFSCKAKELPCKKPKVDVQLPWNIEPISQVDQSLSQHPITDDAETFTEAFIRVEHKEVIDGITKIYQTLKLMDYIDDAEIIYPPHPYLPAQELASLGLESEAIALLRYLPYLNIEDEITPYTEPYNYLRDVEEARDVLWERKNDLAPWVIRLSYVWTRPSDFGRTIIYDIRTKKITQWPNNTPSYANTYLDFPAVSPTEMFDEWMNFLRELKEIPWRQPRFWRSVKSEYPAAPFNWIDLVSNGMVAIPPTEAEKSLWNQGSRDWYNFARAHKHLFISHGWPDDFHASEFKEAKRVWLQENERLEKNKKQANQADTKEKTPNEYSKFLEDTAGPGALKKS